MYICICKYIIYIYIYIYTCNTCIHIYTQRLRCTYMYMPTWISMIKCSFTDSDVVSLGVKHSNRCTTGPLTQQLGVMSVISQTEMLNFLVRNIWTNNNISSEQSSYSQARITFSKYIFFYLLPLAASLTCGVPLDLQLSDRHTILSLEHRKKVLYLVFVGNLVAKWGKTSKTISINHGYQTQSIPFGSKGRNSKLIIDINFAKKKINFKFKRCWCIKKT